MKKETLDSTRIVPKRSPVEGFSHCGACHLGCHHTDLIPPCKCRTRGPHGLPRARQTLPFYLAARLSGCPPSLCGLEEAADISELVSGVLGSSTQAGRGAGRGGGGGGRGEEDGNLPVRPAPKQPEPHGGFIRERKFHPCSHGQKLFKSRRSQMPIF